MYQQVLQSLLISNALALGAQDHLWHSVGVNLDPAAGKEPCEKELGEASLGPSLGSGAAFGLKAGSEYLPMLQPVPSLMPC